MAQGTGVEGIEEPNENDDVERWLEVDSDLYAAPHASNKDGVIKPEDIKWLCKAAKIWGNESP